MFARTSGVEWLVQTVIPFNSGVSSRMFARTSGVEWLVQTVNPFNSGVSSRMFETSCTKAQY